MTCEELHDLLQDYAGGELVVESRTTVEVHVSGCANCGVLIQSYTHIIRVARALPKCGPLPPSLEARLRAAVLPELKRDQSPPA